MSKILSLLTVLFLTNVTIAEDKWNHFNKIENVSIYSYDVKQGLFLEENFNDIKSFTLKRWGIPDFKINKKIIIYCVLNKDDMKRIFNISNSNVEIKKDSIIMWLILDGNPKEEFPIAFFSVLLKEYENNSNKKYNWIFHRGLCVLNLTSKQINNNIKKYNNKNYNLKDMFAMTEKDWNLLDNNDKLDYDIQAAIFCLLLAKEQSNECLIKFINSDCSDENILKIIKFKNIEDLNKTYKRYIDNLIKDIKNNKTPNDYLIINVSY